MSDRRKADIRKALIEIWMVFGDYFHDLAHSCYQRAGNLQRKGDG